MFPFDGLVVLFGADFDAEDVFGGDFGDFDGFDFAWSLPVAFDVEVGFSYGEFDGVVDGFAIDVGPSYLAAATLFFDDPLGYLVGCLIREGFEGFFVGEDPFASAGGVAVLVDCVLVVVFVGDAVVVLVVFEWVDAFVGVVRVYFVVLLDAWAAGRSEA